MVVAFDIICSGVHDERNGGLAAGAQNPPAQDDNAAPHRAWMSHISRTARRLAVGPSGGISGYEDSLNGELGMSEIKVAGDKLKSTLKQLLREGNVRRVIIRNASGRTLLD